MYVLSTPFAWTTPNNLQLRCLMKRVWAKLSNTIHCTIVHMVSCLYSTVHPIAILTKTAPSCWSSKAKIRARVFVCLLCWCRNDGNFVARSILLVSKIVRKQGPLKIKNKGHLLFWYLLIRAILNELRRFRWDLCTHFALPKYLAVQYSVLYTCDTWWGISWLIWEIWWQHTENKLKIPLEEAQQLWCIIELY
jgi:hypothetical protein